MIGSVVFVVQTTGRKSNLGCLENGSPPVGSRSKAPERLIDCVGTNVPQNTISVFRDGLHNLLAPTNSRTAYQMMFLMHRQYMLLNVYCLSVTLHLSWCALLLNGFQGYR